MARNRRELTRRTAAFGIACLLLLPACFLERDERPNVLIILTDDQRASGTLDVMPATRKWVLDRGVTFDRSYATTPQCCPSRASIFTGRYTHNHGVLSNEEGWAEKIDEGATLHRHLQDEGYLTALFGKFLNEWDISRNPRYLDEWAIFSGGGRFYYEGGRWNVGGAVRRIPTYYTSYISSRAQEFLTETAEKDDDRPWLLYLHPTAPHSPFTPEDKYKGAPTPPRERNPASSRRREAIAGKADYVRTLAGRQRRIRRHRRKQLRTLMSVDDMVGAVFERLQKLGELDNTLVFFLSDNGYLWGEYGLSGKSVPYLQSSLIPMAVRWPRRVPEGRRSDELVANIDVAPTVLEAAEVEANRDSFDGRSLFDSLAGRGRRSQLLLEHWGIEEKAVPRWASVVTASQQYIEYYDEGGDVTFREYYDLRRDPWQMNNLLSDPDRANDPDVERLSAQLRSLKDCSGRDCP